MDSAVYFLNLKNELKIPVPFTDCLTFLSLKHFSFPNGIRKNPISDLPLGH